jgi:hypothetical protein
MSRLDEALERLERAVARLEAASVGGARIETRLLAPEAEAAQLRAAAGEIGARVDGALARIGRALGGEG